MKRWRRSIAVVSLAAAFGSGCLYHRLEQPPRRPEPLSESSRQELGPPPGRVVSHSLDANSIRWRGTSRYHEDYEVTLTNALNGADGSVEFDYYLPHAKRTERSANAFGRPQKIPAILILPVMGGTNYDLESYFARSFGKRGFASAILHRPDIKKEVRELEDIDGLLRRSVRDAERVIDWLETQPQVDASRLGLFGVSLGAIRGTLVVALDPRVRAGVLGLVGGDLPYILTHTQEKGLVRERDKILETRQMSLKEVEEKLREIINCDPLKVAPAVDPTRVLMVIAAFDAVIPARKGWELRRKLGNPAAVQIFSGHYTAVLYAPWLRWKTGRFFEKKFREPDGPGSN
jgi:hypothetical protein